MPLAATLLFVAVVQIVTMPRFLYPGDNFAPRIEALDIVLNQRFGIPYAEREMLGGLVEERGQYFYENDARERLFSKYGIANTLMMFPPVLMDVALNGPPDSPLDHRESLLFWINIYQAALTVLTAFYLYVLAGLLSRRIALRIGFTLLTIYTTYVWCYVRAPALEIFQIPAYLGMVYHAIVFARRSAVPGGRQARSAWRHLAASMSYAGFLLLLKTVFGISLACVVLFVVLSGEQGVSWKQRLQAAFGRDFRRFALYGALPVLCAMGVLLLANAVRYGSALDMGYGQHIRGGVPHDHLALKYLPVALPHFFYRPGNANLFIVYPIFYLALPAALWWAWKQRSEGGLLLGLFLANVLMMAIYSCWRGEWCYGPRYLVLYLMTGSLPLVAVLEDGWDRWRRRALALTIVVLLLGAHGLRMQVYFNATHYFTFHYIEQFFKPPFTEVPEVQHYLQQVNRRGRGMLHRDVRRHARGEQTFPPYAALEQAIPTHHPQRAQILGQYDAMLRHFGQANYYLFRDR